MRQERVFILSQRGEEGYGHMGIGCWPGSKDHSLSTLKDLCMPSGLFDFLLWTADPHAVSQAAFENTHSFKSGLSWGMVLDRGWVVQETQSQSLIGHMESAIPWFPVTWLCFTRCHSLIGGLSQRRCGSVAEYAGANWAGLSLGGTALLKLTVRCNSCAGHLLSLKESQTFILFGGEPHTLCVQNFW